MIAQAVGEAATLEVFDAPLGTAPYIPSEVPVTPMGRAIM